MSKDTDFLESINACQDGVEFVAKTCLGSLKTGWRLCKRSEWMCWLLRTLQADEKKLRLLACRFVRETPLADGRKVWDLLTDERSRNAVVVAERFVRGATTSAELAAARAAAWAAGDAAWDAAWAAGVAAVDAAGVAAGDAAWAAAWAAGAAARDAAWAAGAAAGAAAGDAQCKIIREMFSWDEIANLIEATKKA